MSTATWSVPAPVPSPLPAALELVDPVGVVEEPGRGRVVGGEDPHPGVVGPQLATKLVDVHDDGAGESPGRLDGRTHGGAGARDPGRAVRLVLAVGLATYAWWAVGLAPFSAQATAAVVLAGVAAMAVGGRERRRRSPTDGNVSGIAPWAALAVVAGAWQLAAYLQHPRADHPTVSSLANELLDSHPARAAAFLVWIAAARWFARR